MGGNQSSQQIAEKAAYERAGLSIEEAQKLELEEKEDKIRDEECSSCRFIPIRPNPKTRGVSFFCMPSICPNSPNNIFFHSKYFFDYWGEVGFHYLDVHRNFFFGISSIFSVLGVAMLIIGASALSTNPAVVGKTYWAFVSTKNATAAALTGNQHTIEVRVGLKALKFQQCEQGFGCHDSQTITFSDTENCARQGIFGQVCAVCAGAAAKQASSVAFSAITKAVALFSMQKRMYAYADSPSLKLVGVLSEISGAISLGSGLGYFDHNCLAACGNAFDPKVNPSAGLSNVIIAAGNGYVCFLVGLLACLVRAALHLLTPLPRKGKGLVMPFCRCLSQGCRGDGCCVLYVDDVEEEKHIAQVELVHQVKDSIGHPDRIIPENSPSPPVVHHTEGHRTEQHHHKDPNANNQQNYLVHESSMIMEAAAATAVVADAAIAVSE